MLSSIYRQNENGGIHSLKEVRVLGRVVVQKHLISALFFNRGQTSVPKVRDWPRNIPAGKEGRALKVRVSLGARLPGFDS